MGCWSFYIFPLIFQIERGLRRQLVPSVAAAEKSTLKLRLRFLSARLNEFSLSGARSFL